MLKNRKLLCLTVLLFCGSVAFALTAGDYRSVDDGAWAAMSTWEYFDGTYWVSATAIPSSSSETITIRSGNEVFLSNGNYYSVDQLIVEGGAELQVPDGSSITVEDGTGTDLVVDGTLALGGSLHGSGKVVINGTLNWYYSTFNDWSSFSAITNTDLNIGTAGTLNLTHSNNMWLFGAQVHNGGTINLGAGPLHGIRNNSNALLENLSTGIINISTDGTNIYTSSSTSTFTYGFQLTNAGIIRKSSGSGTTTFQRLDFYNNGSVLVESGTLNIYCYNNNPGHTGTFTLTTGTSLILNGYDTQNFAEGSVIDGNGNVQIINHNINFLGTSTGTIFGSDIILDFSSGSIGGSGKATIYGIMSWSGGTHYGTLVIAAGAQFDVSGSEIKELNSGEVYNYGTWTYTDTGNLHGINNSYVYNQSSGVIDIQNDTSIYSNVLGGIWSDGFYFINNGIIKKSAGTGTTTFERIILNNNHLFQVQTGTALFGFRANVTNSGTFQIEDGTTCTISGSYISFNNFSSSTLNNGIFDIAGTFKFDNANIVTNNATISLDGVNSQILNSSDENALANLATNNGSLTFSNSRSLSTSAATFTNNGSLACGEGVLSGSGNFTNAAGSTLLIGSAEGIASSGSTGNIQSSGTRTFTANATYTYNGSSAQITGDGLPATLDNLNVENSNGVTATNGFQVDGTLTLSSGNLDLNGKNIVLGTSALLSETAGNTVKGSSGSIRTTRNLSGISAENVGGLGAVITCGTDMGSTIISRGHAAQASGSNYGILRYFDITPTTNFGLNATLGFQYDESELNGIPETHLTLFRSSDGGSTWQEQGGVIDEDNNIVTLSGLDGFSRWTLCDTDSPLPVVLSSFTAEMNDNVPTLYWTTQSETENLGWNVYRGNAETSWEIGEAMQLNAALIPGEETTSTPSNYSFTDQYPVQENNVYYYWLESISLSGELELYGPVGLLVEFEEAPQPFSDLPEVTILQLNYPNPFNPETRIDFDIKDGETGVLTIFNLRGQIVTKQTFSAGTHSYLWQAGDQASGVYLYCLQTPSYKLMRKMCLIK